MADLLTFATHHLRESERKRVGRTSGDQIQIMLMANDRSFQLKLCSLLGHLSDHSVLFTVQTAATRRQWPTDGNGAHIKVRKL